MDPSSTAYDGPIVDAVKSYQVRHGEIADGRLKPKLIKEMNVPLQLRVRQIELTLERWRWMEHSFSQPPVLVNLPEFRLRAFNGSAIFPGGVLCVSSGSVKSPLIAFTARRGPETARRESCENRHQLDISSGSLGRGINCGRERQSASSALFTVFCLCRLSPESSQQNMLSLSAPVEDRQYENLL